MKLQNIINTMLFEQSEDEWVKISPEEYLDLLDVVGGYGSRIKKIKGYKDKKIWIDGDLKITDKDVTDLEGIDYVNGNLDITWTKIPYFDEKKVKGHFKYYGSKMDKIEKDKLRKKNLEYLDNLRDENAWNIENGEDISLRTEALYTTLEGNGIPTLNEDKYYILPDRNGVTFTWLGENDYESEYTVYTRDEADRAVQDYVEDMLNDIGFEAFSEWLFTSNIDYDYTERYLKEYYEEMIYDDPENWEVPLSLSSDQQKYIDISKKRISQQQERLKNEQLTDEEKKKIEDYINELDLVIEDIVENPEGDYDDDAIEEMAASYADDQKDDIINVLKDWGFDDKSIIKDFIKVDGMVEDILSNDGYSILAGYDGDYAVEHYDGEDYIVFRTN